MKPLSLRTSVIAILVIVAVGMLAAVAVATIPSFSPKLAAATSADKATQYCDSFVSHVASNLGKAPDEVKSAIAKAVDQTLADAVSNGDMTQAEADKIKNQVAQSGGGCKALAAIKKRLGSAGGGAATRGKALAFGIEAAATALNTTPADLKKEIGGGKTLHAIADAKGVSKDQFKAGVKASLAKRLDPAVQSGKMTQDKENQTLTMIDGWIDRVWDVDLSARRAPATAKPTPTP